MKLTIGQIFIGYVIAVLAGQFLAPPDTSYIVPERVCSNITGGVVCAHCFKEPQYHSSALDVKVAHRSKIIEIAKCHNIACSEMVQLIDPKIKETSIEQTTATQEFLKTINATTGDVFRQILLNGNKMQWVVLTKSLIPIETTVTYQIETIRTYLANFCSLLTVITLSAMLLLSWTGGIIKDQGTLIISATSLVLKWMSYYLNDGSQLLSQPDLYHILAEAFFLYYISFEIGLGKIWCILVFMFTIVIQNFKATHQIGTIVIALFVGAYSVILAVRLWININKATEVEVISLLGYIVYSISYLLALAFFKVYDNSFDNLMNIVTMHATIIMLLVQKPKKPQLFKGKPYEVSRQEEQMEEIDEEEQETDINVESGQPRETTSDKI